MQCQGKDSNLAVGIGQIIIGQITQHLQDLTILWLLFPPFLLLLNPAANFIQLWQADGGLKDIMFLQFP